MKGASRFALLVGGVGVGATVLGLVLWGQAVALLSGLVIAVTAVQRRNGAGIAGAAALLVAMAAAGVGKAAPFNATVVLHLGLALALLLLARSRQMARI
jgi:hypothetical protein